MNSIIHDMPDPIYRQAEGVSNSMLKHLKQSPAHFRYALKHPEEPTPAMLFGRIVHHGVFTPSVPPFWSVRPEGMDGRTKEGKAWIAEHPVNITRDEWNRAFDIVTAIHNHPTASKAIGNGKAEVSWFADFDLGGTVQRKGRIDWVSEGDALVDLKTCEDARPEKFVRDAYNYGYHRQAAYYLDGWNAAICDDTTPKTFFVIIAVEKNPPHGVMVYNLSNELIQSGRLEYTELLQRYIECQETGIWPGYTTEIETLNLPPWATKREMMPWITA